LQLYTMLLLPNKTAYKHHHFTYLLVLLDGNPHRLHFHYDLATYTIFYEYLHPKYTHIYQLSPLTLLNRQVTMHTAISSYNKN